MSIQFFLYCLGNMLPLTPEKELALRARMGPLARRDIIQEIFRRPT